MSFLEEISKYKFEEIKKSILFKKENDVRIALSKDVIDLEDFKALISFAGEDYLEEIAQKSRKKTLQRFGNNINLYIPLYLSNECQNICTYCGFSMENKIPRKRLNQEEILQEAIFIKKMGFDNILLVTGEMNEVNVDYLISATKILKPYFSNISIEVQPLKEEEYILLKNNGVNGVYIYQETYNRDNYKLYHKKGKKANYENRLNSVENIGKANIDKIGIGALYGLEDWQVEAFFTAAHLRYLEKNYWKSRFSISFPRLKPNVGGLKPNVIFSDKNFVQLICAFRLLSNEVELSLSTREDEKFRDRLINIGITNFSAASKTNPGGYTLNIDSLEQFEISDQRKIDEIKKSIENQGYQVIWKDWDRFLN